MNTRHDESRLGEHEDAPESENRIRTVSERIARANERVSKVNEPMKEKTAEREIGRKLVLEMIRLQAFPKGRLSERLNKLQKELEALPPATDDESDRRLLLKEVEVDTTLIEAHREEIRELKEAKQKLQEQAEAKKEAETERLHSAIGRGWLGSFFHRFLPKQPPTDIAAKESDVQQLITELDDHIFTLEDEIETAEDAINNAKSDLRDLDEHDE